MQLRDGVEKVRPERGNNEERRGDPANPRRPGDGKARFGRENAPLRRKEFFAYACL